MSDDANVEYVERTFTRTFKIVHGTAGAYHGGCRCDLCTAAQTAKTKEYRNRRKVAKAEVIEHCVALLQDGPDVSAAATEPRLYSLEHEALVKLLNRQAKRYRAEVAQIEAA